MTRTKPGDRLVIAVSESACKAYKAIGFQRTGHYIMLGYQEPQVTYG